jgi:hypothetical protein
MYKPVPTQKKSIIATSVIIFCLTLIITPKITAQQNFLPGYYINIKGDTINGYIDYRKWELTPKTIQFKAELSTTTQTFSPHDIKEFKVANEKFISATVDVEISPTDKEVYKDYNPELKIIQETVFLHVLINGSKSLLFLGREKEQFYINTDSAITLLAYKKYMKLLGWNSEIMHNDIKTSLIENKKYVGQLMIYLNDCPTIKPLINKTGYNKKSLERLFISYYKNCRSSEPVSIEETPEKATTTFGITAGTTLSALSFNSTVVLGQTDHYDYLRNTNFPGSTNYSMGVYLEYMLARKIRKFSFYNELLYTSFQFKGNYLRYLNEDRYSNFKTELNYSYLKLFSMLRYNIPMGKMNMFAGGGMSNGIKITEKNYLINTTTFYSTETTTESKAIPETKKHEFGYVLGIGTSLKRFSCELRYENGNGMSKTGGLKSSTQRYHFILGYRF